MADKTDFWAEVVRRRTHGRAVDYLICDEAQFYRRAGRPGRAGGRRARRRRVRVRHHHRLPHQRLSPGSARLVELADRVEVLQVRALCWCGRAPRQTLAPSAASWATAKAIRSSSATPRPTRTDVVGYEVLCRRHHRRRITAASARAVPVAGSAPARDRGLRCATAASREAGRAAGLRTSSRGERLTRSRRAISGETEGWARPSGPEVVHDCSDGFDLDELAAVAQHGHPEQGARDVVAAEGVADDIPCGAG